MRFACVELDPTRERPSGSELIHCATRGLPEGYMEGLPPDILWLFPSVTARGGHTVDIRKPYRRVVQAAGMDPAEVVRHTLRHTAITHLVQAGVDLPTVKRISGHTTLQMVERYAHANGEHIAAAMDMLERRYKEAG